MRFLVPVAEEVFLFFTHFISGRAAQVEDAIVTEHPDVAIISGRDFQTEDPILNAVRVNFHHHWLLWFFFCFCRARARLRLFFFSFLRLFLLLFFLSLSAFIALPRERICGLLRQRDEGNPVHFPIEVCKFLVAYSWS